VGVAVSENSDRSMPEKVAMPTRAGRGSAISQSLHWDQFFQGKR